MSGGSMDYLYTKIQYVRFPEDTPERRAFAKHLQLVAKALHDIEWVDSGDCVPGDENKSIRECLSKTAILEETIQMAKEVQAALAAEIDRVFTRRRYRNGSKTSDCEKKYSRNEP